jgi:hypothetical protein
MKWLTIYYHLLSWLILINYYNVIVIYCNNIWNPKRNEKYEIERDKVDFYYVKME